MKDALGELHPSRTVARRMHELELELERARGYRRRHSKSPDTTGRWGLEQPAAAQQEEGWFITYLDMMTLLLVVMIVMLAFSGSIGEGTRNATAQETQPASAAISDAATAPSIQSTPDGDGLLPGGAGLFAGQSRLPDTLAVSEPLPESSAANVIPSPAASSADIGPLPSDFPTTPDQRSAGSAAGSMNDLYPGWSGADLAASFIGPPRPRFQAPVTEPQPSDHESSFVGPRQPDTEAPMIAASPATADGPPANENDPSEGESLAAGLSLGELGSDVMVVVNERSVSFRVNSEILFDSSQADLSRSGLAVLRRIVGVLSDTGHEVTVEGHTDAVPVRRNMRYPSNWELSSARAGSVVRYLQANGIDRSRLKAVGYADTRPIADNHTPDGRAINRRVELLIEKRD